MYGSRHFPYEFSSNFFHFKISNFPFSLDVNNPYITPDSFFTLTKLFPLVPITPVMRQKPYMKFSRLCFLEFHKKRCIFFYIENIYGCTVKCYTPREKTKWTIGKIVARRRGTILDVEGLDLWGVEPWDCKEGKWRTIEPGEWWSSTIWHFNFTPVQANPFHENYGHLFVQYSMKIL